MVDANAVAFDKYLEIGVLITCCEAHVAYTIEWFVAVEKVHVGVILSVGRGELKSRWISSVKIKIGLRIEKVCRIFGSEILVNNFQVRH